MLEDKRVADCDLFTDPVIHSIDVCLVNRHTLLGERWRIVDRDVVQLGVITPVLVWNTPNLAATYAGQMTILTANWNTNWRYEQTEDNLLKQHSEFFTAHRLIQPVFKQQ